MLFDLRRPIVVCYVSVDYNDSMSASALSAVDFTNVLLMLVYTWGFLRRRECACYSVP